MYGSNFKYPRAQARLLGGGPAPAFSPDLLHGPLDPRIVFSRPSLATMFDSTGKMTFCPNNLLLNSAVLAGQGVSVRAVPHILSFKGTGIVTLSGASTAGPLVGTGANNRVYLAFVPTATTLVLNVSGSVTSARLSAVTYETAFRAVDDVDTGASAYYGPRFDYNPLTLQPRGLLIEGARSNSYKVSDLSSSTSADGLALSTDGTLGPDGLLAQKVTLNAGAGYHRLFQAHSHAANSVNTFSVYVEPGTQKFIALTCYNGTDSIAVAVFDLSANVDSVATQTAVGATAGAIIGTPIATYIGNGIFRLQLTCQIAGSVGGFLFIQGVPAATGNVITTGGLVSWTSAGQFFYASGVQDEAGYGATALIPTGSTTVSCSADVASISGTDFSGWYNPSEGTIVCSAESYSFPVNTRYVYAMGNNTDRTFGIVVNDINTTRMVNTDASAATFAGGVYTSGGIRKTAMAYKTDDSAGSYDGNAAVADTSVTVPVVTGMYLGANQSGSQQFNGWIREFSCYNTRRPNADLPGLTT